MDPTRAVARTEHLVLWSRLGRRFRSPSSSGCSERAVPLRVPGVHPPCLGASSAPSDDASLSQHRCGATRVRPSLPPGELAGSGRYVLDRLRRGDRCRRGRSRTAPPSAGARVGGTTRVATRHDARGPLGEGEGMIAGREASAALDLAERLPVDGTRLSPGEEAQRLPRRPAPRPRDRADQPLRLDVRGRGRRAGSGRSVRSSATAARSRSASTARAGRGGPTRRFSIAHSGPGRSCCRPRSAGPRPRADGGAVPVPLPLEHLRPEGEARVRLLA